MRVLRDSRYVTAPGTPIRGIGLVCPFSLLGVLYTPIVENQVEKKMESESST